MILTGESDVTSIGAVSPLDGAIGVLFIFFSVQQFNHLRFTVQRFVCRAQATLRGLLIFSEAD